MLRRLQRLTRTTGVVALAFVLSATAAPGTITQAAVCRADRAFESAVRVQASEARQEIRQELQPLDLTEPVEHMRQAIEETELRTGGKLRDFFVGGGSSYDKQVRVEEYLLPRLRPAVAGLEYRAEHQAEVVQQVLDVALADLSSPEPETKGLVSASGGSASRTSRSSRSGSLRLQQRNAATFGITFDTVGRFTYTVEARYRTAVSGVRIVSRYDRCGGTGFAELSYRGRVTVQPQVTVRYRFSTVGRGRGRYQSFSGRMTILGRDQQIQRELDVVRAL